QNLVGPNLANIATRSEKTIADPTYEGQAESVEAYLKESLLEPNIYTVPGFVSNVMPTYEETLTVTEIETVIAYLMTLD
ncbi:MAG: cytochrome c, partial [Chloroflexota bacterium]